MCVACAHPPAAGVPVPSDQRWIELPQGEEEAGRIESVGVKHLLRGLYFIAVGESGAAIPHLRLALIYTPDSAFIHERLSRAWAATGNLERARRSLDAGLERTPEDPWLNWLAGDLAARELRFRDAVAHLRRASASDEVLPESGAALVDVLLWLGDVKAADESAQAMMRRRPGDGELATRVAGQFEDHGELDMSLREYQRARVRRPGDRRAALGESRVLGMLARHDEAADTLVPMFALYPDMPELYVLLTRLLVRAGRPEAEAYRGEALRQANGDVFTTMAVATGDLLEGRIAEGLDLLRALVVGEPDHLEPRLFLAEALARLGDGQGCLGALEVTTTQPSPRLHQPRAWCWALQDRVDLAMEQMTWAVLDSGRPRDGLLDAARLLSQFAVEAVARRTLSDLLIRCRQRITEEDATVARAHLADLFGHGVEALELVAQLPRERLQAPEMVLRVADLESRNGRLASAIEALRALVREHPRDPLRLNALGFVLADANVRLDEAEVYLRRAHRLAPDDGYIIDSLGWLLYRRGAMEQAVVWLLRASRASPGDPEILRHLGDAYRALGKRDAARAAFRAALDAKPPPPLRALIEKRLEVGTS